MAYPNIDVDAIGLAEERARTLVEHLKTVLENDQDMTHEVLLDAVLRELDGIKVGCDVATA